MPALYCPWDSFRSLSDTRVWLFHTTFRDNKFHRSKTGHYRLVQMFLHRYPESQLRTDLTGANMVLVDFHPYPSKALVDGPQALHIDELGYFLKDIAIARKAYEARVALCAKHQARSARS